MLWEVCFLLLYVFDVYAESCAVADGFLTESYGMYGSSSLYGDDIAGFFVGKCCDEVA